MFQRVAVSVLLSCLLVPTAEAKEKPYACYTNSYDKKHMAKNPGQTVTTIKVTFLDVSTLENPGSDMWAEFEVTLRGEGKTKWGDTALCNGKNGHWDCGIECDGGGFQLDENESGLTLSNSRGFRVAPDGGCDDGSTTVDAKPGNRLFRLTKAKKLSACK
jgi:hypothetical protein